MSQTPTQATKKVDRFKQVNVKNFVHLHNHSHYSLLDGLQKVPEMLDRVKKLGMGSVALTDHGTLSGAIEFYKEAKVRGIKPIIGTETYVAPRKHTDKEGKEDANPYHLILLAMNNRGYQNLMKLSSIASLDGFYYKPRIDHDLLEKYNEGIIVLSACASGEVGNAIRNDQLQEAKSIARWYKRIFGDRYYLEVQDHAHQWDVQKKINDEILRLGKELDIKVVVTSDAHYTVETDQEAHEILLCVQTGSQLNDERRMSLRDMHLFISDPKDIAARWLDYPEVLENTSILAKRCDVEIELGKILIPTFDTPAGEDESSLLRKKAVQGLAWRYGNKTIAESVKMGEKEVKQIVSADQFKKLEYELSVINKMGFAGYFLIVADFVNWSKNKGIIIGPGRGSGASSIVAYSLNITDIDPLKYDLLFERFLNPDRISMPDFDIDFQDDRRDEVIEYVTKKYGAERVAHIATFGKMAARNAIRDTARVLGVSYNDADRLAKMVPPPVQGRHILLAKSIKQNKELKTEYNTNKQSKQVIDLAIRLEGTIRSHGVHAAGVVIAPEEITHFTPLEMAQKGVVATQYSMGPIEELGLLKMDFLGLSNLTIIKNALRIIRKVYKKNIDITRLPLDDKKTYELLSRGETTGVFQLESAGMKRYLKQLKPTEFSDIIAMGALYRPGPMAEIPRYIQGKHDPAKATYPHPLLEPILKDTYGVMVYQEQIIAMLQLIAGYSPGEADLIRKAIGKKKRDIMNAEEPRFVDGCVKKGINKHQAKALWALIQPFADYSFNKAHAACYGLIAYQTAYIKAHFPSALMAALLTSDFEDTDRIAIELAECKQMGIKVLPPDINESFVEFAVQPKTGAIRFGLSAIKNVGVGAVEEILKARAQKPFSTIEDFARRVSPKSVNKKTWESLIKTGAFDKFEDRKKLLGNLDLILSYASKFHKNIGSPQIDLFGTGSKAGELHSSLTLDEQATLEDSGDQLQWERQLLGVYLSEHPLDKYQEILNSESIVSIKDISTQHEGKRLEIGGLITTIRRITTKNGANMAFVMVEDYTSSLELVVFPKVFEDSASLWQEDTLLRINGKISSKDKDGQDTGEPKMLVDSVRKLDNNPLRSVNGEITITLRDTTDPETLNGLKAILMEYPGNTEVIIAIGGMRGTQIRLPFGVDFTPELQKRLDEAYDPSRVKVTV